MDGCELFSGQNQEQISQYGCHIHVFWDFANICELNTTHATQLNLMKNIKAFQLCFDEQNSSPGNPRHHYWQSGEGQKPKKH